MQEACRVSGPGLHVAGHCWGRAGSEEGSGLCGVPGREPLAVSGQFGAGGSEEVMFELDPKGREGVDYQLWGLAEAAGHLSSSGREMLCSVQRPSRALSALCYLLCM